MPFLAFKAENSIITLVHFWFFERKITAFWAD